MRRFFAILALMVATTVAAHAQSIRFGESIPSLNLQSSIDETLAIYNRDYVCLIFAHSESKPCVDAMRNFAPTAQAISKQCAIVVITTESELNKASIVERLGIEDYILAFDSNGRTFKAFGINYVPFAVIYRTKNSHIEWFGPMHHIETSTFQKTSRRSK